MRSRYLERLSQWHKAGYILPFELGADLLESPDSICRIDSFPTSMADLGAYLYQGNVNPATQELFYILFHGLLGVKI